MGRGRRGRIYFAARLALFVAFLIVVFAFHPHGTTLDIVQAVRFVLLVALIGTAWLARRRQSKPTVGESDA
jgi:predicted lysophospholipase L1 biosynthesis ABC-type transport system permease subunit